MKVDWEEVSLSAAGVSLIDCEHRTPPASNVGCPYVAIPQIKNGRIDFTGARRITSELFVEWTRKASPQHHDVILSRRCNPGETAFVPAGPPFALGQNLVLLRADGRKIFPPFLRWLVRGPEWWEQIQKFINVGAVFDSLKCADIPNFRLRVPPINEQKAIAGVLGTLDDKIELNQRMNETLEAIAQAIFESWFVDFDPVRAKAAGQSPPCLDPEIAALFPDRFEPSGLGKIPMGWNSIPIFELAEINAWTLGKDDELDRVEYIEISEVSRGNIRSIQVFERGEEPSRARRRLRHGDTVMSTVRPDRGSYFLCLHPSPYSIASTGFAVVTPTRAPWSFIHAALTQSDVFEHLGQQADGGAYPAISPEIIGKWQVTWPDQSAIVGAFHKMCGALYELAEQNRRQLRILAAMRDALLPKLLSGEVRVEYAPKK